MSVLVGMYIGMFCPSSEVAMRNKSIFGISVWLPRRLLWRNILVVWLTNIVLSVTSISLKWYFVVQLSYLPYFNVFVYSFPSFKGFPAYSLHPVPLTDQDRHYIRTMSTGNLWGLGNIIGSLTFLSSLFLFHNQSDPGSWIS